jgi:outer membrane protein TolC
MRPLQRLARLSCAFGLIGGLRAAAPASYSLDDALDRVTGTNLALLVSREAVVQAVAQSRLIRAGALPNVSASLQQRRARTVTVTNDLLTTSAPTDRYDGLLTGSLPLLDPVRWSALQSARLASDVARADYETAVQAILAAVADGYFTHLRNLRRLEVLDANISRARSLLELAQNQLRAGAATQIDVTRAEAQLAQAEQARLQQETVDVQSELALKRALEIDAAQPIALQNVTLRRIDADTVATDDPARLFGVRPDYRRAQRAVEQARADLRTARFEPLPTLVLGAQAGYAGSRLDQSGSREQWSAAVGLSMPVFDGLRASADRQIARSRLRAQEARLHDLERQITAELRFAAQDARSRNAQIGVAEKNLRLAHDQLDLAQRRYQQGIADNREVVEAQTQLAVAEDLLVEATYQYQLSRVELARVHGNVRDVRREQNP